MARAKAPAGVSGSAAIAPAPVIPPVVRAPVSNTPERLPEGETSFQLLNRARGGDAEAREALCALYLPRLHRWAKGRMPPAARGPLDTGDIVQEVLMQVIAKLDVFEPQELWSFQAYLRRTLQHRLCDVARRAKRVPAAGSLDTSSPSADVSPFEAAVKAEDRERYQAALKRLRRDDQRAVIARCEWDMSYQEVAELLGKSTPNAARVAIHRALLRLAKDMAHARRQAARRS
jgi:RNA polymerase sigma-70 factor (ECF subfamily)